MGQLKLTKTRIQAGVYEGILSLTGNGPRPPQLNMVHLDKSVGQVRLTAVKGGTNQWSLRASIPSGLLTDGVQAFLIVDGESKDILDKFTIITGQPLEDDIRAEIELLRAELDMLKMAFRRHCIETGA